MAQLPYILPGGAGGAITEGKLVNALKAASVFKRRSNGDAGRSSASYGDYGMTTARGFSPSS